MNNFLINNPYSLIALTDSYKFGHWAMYLDGTQNIYSYFENRVGSLYDETVFYGLQMILKKHLAGIVITQEMIEAAEEFTHLHFLGNTQFNRQLWERVVNVHGGKLPVRIKAVPEGSRIPISNILMSVEITDEELTKMGEALLAPLTNHLEGILTHVWAPSNVATISRNIRDTIEKYFKLSVPEENHWLIDYTLHDFGFRGVTCAEGAGMLGSGLLTSFKGTDTPIAVLYGMKYYNTTEMLGHSVNASEHSVMCQKGAEFDIDVLKAFIRKFPDGILSIVGDSKSIETFVDAICDDVELIDIISNRNGKFVVRPDSPRFEGDTAHDQVLWILERLEKGYGSTINNKGYKELNPKVGVIYGDGLSAPEIQYCIEFLVENEWAASSCVYGMGGGLLQKHNRDTQRSAFKCSARKENGVWYDVSKQPKDASKASKAGRLKLIIIDGEYKTVREDEYPEYEDILVTVFENGELVNELNFNQVIENCKTTSENYGN